jgi:cytochrome c-type biogenesis protein CcsB
MKIMKEHARSHIARRRSCTSDLPAHQAGKRKTMSVVLVLLSLLATPQLLNAPARAGGSAPQPSAQHVAAPYDPAMEQAVRRSDLPRLAVQSEGIEESLASFSRTALSHIIGRTKVRGQNPVYTIIAMMFDPQRWRDANIIPVDNLRLARAIGLPGDLSAQAGGKQFISAERVQEMGRPNEQNPANSQLSTLNSQLAGDPAALRALERMIERAAYLYALPQTLRILPNPTLAAGAHEVAPAALSAQAGWLSVAEISTERGPRERVRGVPVSSPERARAFMKELAHAFRTGSPEAIAPATRDFLQYAKTLRGYPPDWKRNVSYFYTIVNPFKWCYVLYLFACLFFLFYIVLAQPPQPARTGGSVRSSPPVRPPARAGAGKITLRHVALALLVAGFALHTGGMALRYVLAGRAPLANMYETIIFAVWGLIGIGLILEPACTGRLRPRPLPAPARAGGRTGGRGYIGLFSSGFAFIVMVVVSLLPLRMTRIEPLRAVLNSSWLTYHVTTVTLSYSAFMLSFLFSLAYLVKDFGPARAGGRERLVGWLPAKETFDLLNYRAVQIGWPLLIIGILTGAVWANTAWGRFWGWDPKETWSLITWIIYTIFLHLRINQRWRGRKTAYAAIIGFLAVLMTWFGVSYLPIFHGLHTYA